MPGPPMPASASAPLDGTPPSPQLLGGGPMGQPSPLSLNQLAPNDPMAAGAMPPEILTGILSSAQRIEAMLDAYAQVAPDLAVKFALLKSDLASVLAELVQRGAQPTSPTATGAAFPGGGMDRGIPSGGTV